MKVTEVIGSGSTIEEAKQNALDQVKDDYDDVDFEIIQKPEKKVLGLFGGADAKIKATVKKSKSREAKEFLLNILSKLAIKDMDVEEIKGENGVTFNVTGEDLGVAIGYRGETLEALQYLTGLVANKSNSSFYRVTVNMGDYKQQRERALISYAKKTAYTVLKTGKSIAVKPMNSYERRLVHTTVQDIKGVKSWSEGEKKDRHVIIGIDENDTRPDDKFSLYEKLN